MARACKTTWTNFERFVASIFGTRRNPLSGANNVSDQGKARIGDVIVPPGYTYFVECKHRRRHALHTMFRTAQTDDESRTLFFFTHELRQTYDESLVTMTAATFKQIWPLISHLFTEKEEVKPLDDWADPLGLTRETETTPQDPKPKGPKRSSKTKKADRKPD